MNERTKIIIIASILITASFIYLVFLGMKEGSMYYLEVSELFDRLDDLGQRKVRVNGEIFPNSVNFDLNTLKLNFSMKDIKGSQRLNVVYKGTPPDLLEQEGVTLVAEGSYNRERGIFEAKKLLVKCPSKYEKKEGEG
jgi:cytochrome c-type biogenesis protein CcmE